MNKKQLVAISALPALTGAMILVYRWLARRLEPKQAWYAGFLVYWLVGCILLPLRLLGLERLRVSFRDRRPDPFGRFMLLFPPGMAFLGRFVLDKQPRQLKDRLGLTFTALMNGTLEEVLWRGVYVELFPDRPLWAVAWPTLWFALWHYAPGSVSPLTDVWTLVTGAGMYGACLGWLALKRGSIRWPVVSHLLAGLVQALG